MNWSVRPNTPVTTDTQADAGAAGSFLPTYPERALTSRPSVTLLPAERSESPPSITLLPALRSASPPDATLLPALLPLPAPFKTMPPGLWPTSAPTTESVASASDCPTSVQLAKAPKTSKPTVKPPGLPPEIDRVLPKWRRVNDAPKGKEHITTVNGLYRRAAKGNRNTFDYTGYAKDLKAVETNFSNLVTSPVQRREFAAAIQRARSAIPGKEAAPPRMAQARGGSTDDKNVDSFKAGADAGYKNMTRADGRGDLVETQRYVPTKNGFDGNSNFTRVVGTANSNKLPVYKVAGASKSYVMPIDLSKISLQPIAQRSANGAGVATNKQPNPLYANSTVTQFADRAVQGRVPGIDPQKLLGAFNSAFFNTYGPETTISLASMVAGKVTSTGKVEPGDRHPGRGALAKSRLRRAGGEAGLGSVEPVVAGHRPPAGPFHRNATRQPRCPDRGQLAERARHTVDDRHRLEVARGVAPGRADSRARAPQWAGLLPHAGPKSGTHNGA